MPDIPHTYSEWNKILEDLKYKVEDEEILQVMKKGSIEWQSGIAERFTKKLLDAVNHRMNVAVDRFQRDMEHGKGKEGLLVQALSSFKKEIIFLSEAINLPVIPEKDRGNYLKIIKDQADKIQQSLEDSAKRDRSGKLSVIIRNCRVNQL